MSDVEFSPPKHRNHLPLHIDCDLQFKEREPKCVNSLCNLINTRLKLLENEILTQHKVWEYIQREVDEVKSLIEDCASTCDSSSLSGHENDSEVADSALESHKTCNSLLWDKIKQAEENVEEKKSLMQILSSDVSKLKNSKKKCKKKLEKANSNIDLILEVTNGLNVLKCDDCKFCRDHIDFREGLLTSVIELIHFSEKNNSTCLEENKVLKSGLQKIYMKTKQCLLHSQIYVRNPQLQNFAFETENSSFCTDSIYSSFEEFCQHFQNLQDELMQLKHILLAAEENHLDEVFQSSHSSDCRCYSYTRKRESYENDYERNEMKFSKSNEKNLCYYENKIKCFDDTNEHGSSDPGPVFEDNHLFSTTPSNSDKQLEVLRRRIFEAVKVIRDVEVVENDDENLINMVSSLAEECSALRQEVSYLRNVRQEKKRTWNKLQCFIMDAERKLKGSNRNIPDLREVIRDLGQLIATSESSSLDETVLYMYSNQLEWAEKLSMGCESPSCPAPTSEDETSDNCQIVPNYQSYATTCTSSTQTSIDIFSKTEPNVCPVKNTMCNMSTQTDSSLCLCTVEDCHPTENSFQEISREIYVVPEVFEESDQYVNIIEDNYQARNSTEKVNTLGDQLMCNEKCYKLQTLELIDENGSKSVSQTSVSSSIVPLSGNFPLRISLSCKGSLGHIPVLYSKTKSHSFTIPDISFMFCNSFFHSDQNMISDRLNYLSSPLCLNSTANMKHFCNNMFYNMLKDHIKSIEIYDQKNNRSCIVYKSGDSPSSLVSFNRSVKYLPYEPYTSSNITKQKTNHSCVVYKSEDSPSSLVSSNRSVKYLPYEPYTSSDVTNNSTVNKIINSDIEDIVNLNLYICDDVSANNVIVDFSMLSSINDELLPNDDECDTSNENHASANLSISEVCDDSTDFHNLNDMCEESNPVVTNNSVCDFTLEPSETFVQDKPAPVCREGTFIIDSGETFALTKSEEKENFYHTVILTALLSNESRNTEKNYILYEMDSSPKNSSLFLQNVNPLVSNFDNHIAGQHFILCEAIPNNENLEPQAIASNVSCHIAFFRSNVKQANSSIEKHVGISESYPLLPQYLPPETFNFSLFDNFSLAQSCEIYMCNKKSCNIEIDSENIAFTPKNYFKFKELFPMDQSNNLLSQEKVLCQAVFKQNLASNFSQSFEENCDINLNLKNIHPEKDLSEITSTLDLVEKHFPDYDEKETQTDELRHLYVNEKCFALETFSDEFQQELKASAEFEEEKLVLVQKQYIYDNDRQRESFLAYNHSSQEQALRETSLLDEIDALKDNLNQQNAVLLRLKENLEESHFQLAEKEQLLVILQLDHSRLSTMLAENDVREIDEKECQTDFSPSINSEDVEKEVYALRQKNMQHYEKIVHQNHTIQSVKSQLCATISHLKHLKDAATKQLKKQKHYAIKTNKLKQHLHDTKTELERKCQELEKKNEMLSDQEFHLQEMRIRWDSTIEELKEKSRIPNLDSIGYRRINTGCQTDVMNNFNLDESNATCQKSEHDLTLKKHSEELSALNAKFQLLETVLSNKKEHKAFSGEIFGKTNDELKPPVDLKDGNIWKLLTISEQSYLSLLNKLSDALQLSDLKGSSALMHSSWLSCDDLADARRHDHKKILQCLEKMKRSIRYLQESLNLHTKRPTAENTPTDERKSNFTCHSEEMHFQYLCEVLQRAQESLVKDYSQKRSTYRTVVTAGSGRTSRHAGSRERRIPLELKNGKILAVLDDKFNHQELLPNKFDYSKMECKAGTAKSKTAS